MKLFFFESFYALQQFIDELLLSINDSLLLLNCFYKWNNEGTIIKTIQSAIFRIMNTAERVVDCFCCFFYILGKEAGHLNFFYIIFAFPIFVYRFDQF